MERYSRNRIYIQENEQEIIKNTKIFIGGAGIGSIIAECALRFGFECITIVDYDKVELSNLNRQNYTENDLGKSKVEVLAERLLSINPEAKISYHNCLIDEVNVENLIKECNIAINALDFKSDIPFIFDSTCGKHNIPVLHPYNFGWLGFLTVVMPNGVQLSQLSKEPHGFELYVAEYASKYAKFWNTTDKGIGCVVEKYKQENIKLPPPQLSVASWIVAGLCVNVMYDLTFGRKVKEFPKFYLSSIYDDQL